MSSKQVLVLLIVAAFVVFSALGRPTEIVDSALKDNPPTGVIRVRFPSHSGLEEVEIFNRLLEPSSGGMKTEPNNQKNLQKGMGLESKGKDQPMVDSLSPTPEQRGNLEPGQIDPNQAEVAESERQQPY
ncbi:hypothetical protein DAPPUDRAFT_316535 [Daphnia pulex]|uniref:Secreted protein n=1 Tax=Daphnia pulex TaxID=6669 RepID=E9GD78_DAPPU|nr:hypothetical protein DAPPUDRAFT_316535 [Daphnia pulex]|eukprot:EFX82741.1 hypothetical protein DAPPUDRAFT_316535 [Daphnia pulex]